MTRVVSVTDWLLGQFYATRYNVDSVAAIRNGQGITEVDDEDDDEE